MMLFPLPGYLDTLSASSPVTLFKPVSSTASNVSVFGVEEDLAVIHKLTAKEYHAALSEKSLFHRTIRLNVLRAVVEEITEFCNEANGKPRKTF